jgi:predicted CoA-binding protein
MILKEVEDKIKGEVANKKDVVSNLSKLINRVGLVKVYVKSNERKEKIEKYIEIDGLKTIVIKPELYDEIFG